MYIVLLVLAVILLAIVAVSFYFYRIAIARTDKSFLAGNPDLRTDGPSPASQAREWLDTRPLERVSLRSDDGLQLNGYYLAASPSSGKTVILVHGYSGHALQNAAFAKFYHEQLGFHVLMPDNRGHGASEGNVIGFGWLDRKDLLRWIEYVLARSGPASELVLHGVSMGGAAVLMTSGEKLPPQVKAIVSDCAYTSVRDQLAYQLKRIYHLPSFPLLASTSLLTRVLAGYSFGEASAVNQVRQTKTPILFIHGTADTFVPFAMAQSLYDHCPGEKELFIVPGAGHGMAYRTDTAGYQLAVRQFVAKHTAPALEDAYAFSTS
ncbi:MULTISPECIES: alpha/beta hydrolase [unclassified Paenibacillus]|uniref:alpha/beta hydrolase n=1 Tax=unclassified Paenibacillus TaxID=185978 RepID=UPI0009FABBAE|nr:MULTISPECIES: alpha/beta hydrolase [unclassified Paenibacillus]